VLVANTGYRYGGKAFDSGARLPALLARLHSVELVITVADPGIAGTAPPTGVPQRSFADCLGARPIAAAHVGAFGDPLYVLFSSGTTGVPKGIVHGLGGVLLQHGKEHALHCDLGAGDVLFFFTTCGWMMWNWQLSALARGVTIGLYDGSPFHPHAGSLPALLETWGVTAFGAGARYFAGLQQAGYRPRSRHDLSRLRTVMSTGSPLAPAGFEFVYDALKHDVCLASISGGTDLVSCFALGCPTLPVRAGELQVPGLAMDVAFLRPDGSVCARGEAGELVCRRPFPTQPVAFWNDADGTRLHEAYYARHPGVWAHGDFGEVTEQGGIVIHGRADAVLNPGGVRIGTAELYRLVEALPWVAEALAVGQRQDADERIVLFLVLAPGETLDAARQDALRAHIRAGATPRHVPARIVAVADLPRTVNGKLAEIAVRQTIHGEPVTNVDALANPEVLALFRALPELEDCGGR
jgi:acetoacetyl-CoA synthetase